MEQIESGLCILQQNSGWPRQKRFSCSVDVTDTMEATNDASSDPPRNSTRRKRRRMSLSSANHTIERELGDDGHYFECVICDNVGDLLCCDGCPQTFHLDCLNPPLARVPPGRWLCPSCCPVERLAKLKKRSARTTEHNVGAGARSVTPHSRELLLMGSLGRNPSLNEEQVISPDKVVSGDRPDPVPMVLSPNTNSGSNCHGGAPEGINGFPVTDVDAENSLSSPNLKSSKKARHSDSCQIGSLTKASAMDSMDAPSETKPGPSSAIERVTKKQPLISFSRRAKKQANKNASDIQKPLTIETQSNCSSGGDSGFPESGQASQRCNSVDHSTADVPLREDPNRMPSISRKQIELNQEPFEEPIAVLDPHVVGEHNSISNGKKLDHANKGTADERSDKLNVRQVEEFQHDVEIVPDHQNPLEVSLSSKAFAKCSAKDLNEIADDEGSKNVPVEQAMKPIMVDLNRKEPEKITESYPLEGFRGSQTNLELSDALLGTLDINSLPPNLEFQMPNSLTPPSLVIPVSGSNSLASDVTVATTVGERTSSQSSIDGVSENPQKPDLLSRTNCNLSLFEKKAAEKGKGLAMLDSTGNNNLQACVEFEQSQGRVLGTVTRRPSSGVLDMMISEKSPSQQSKKIQEKRIPLDLNTLATTSPEENPSSSSSPGRIPSQPPFISPPSDRLNIQEKKVSPPSVNREQSPAMPNLCASPYLGLSLSSTSRNSFRDFPVMPPCPSVWSRRAQDSLNPLTSRNSREINLNPSTDRYHNRMMFDNIGLRERSTIHGSLSREKKQGLQIGWLEEELDSLWIGVRRYGLGNWEAILRDPKFHFLDHRTAQDLSDRWEDEQWKFSEKVSTQPPRNSRSKFSSHYGSPYSENLGYLSSQSFIPGTSNPWGDFSARGETSNSVYSTYPTMRKQFSPIPYSVNENTKVGSSYSPGIVMDSHPRNYGKREKRPIRAHRERWIDSDFKIPSPRNVVLGLPQERRERRARHGPRRGENPGFLPRNWVLNNAPINEELPSGAPSSTNLPHWLREAFVPPDGTEGPTLPHGISTITHSVSLLYNERRVLPPPSNQAPLPVIQEFPMQKSSKKNRLNGSPFNMPEVSGLNPSMVANYSGISLMEARLSLLPGTKLGEGSRIRVSDRADSGDSSKTQSDPGAQKEASSEETISDDQTGRP
ncbi:hypothetical protein AMTRI_Chr07g25450 [Amborella trichopoda]